MCERVYNVLTGTVLTRCLQGSAQCFAGASGYLRAGMLFSNRDGFDVHAPGGTNFLSFFIKSRVFLRKPLR